MSDKSGVAESVITLPEGGGALSGVGETFSPDLHTGTGNFSVPIEVPAGRNGVQPELTLTYSTGNGNSPFGLGWALSVPGVSRKTSDGVPTYDDGVDTFLLSGAEDLVPVRSVEREVTPDRSSGATVLSGTRYRPRTEGLFARIDHYLNPANDFWEVRSKDGLVSTYGTPQARADDRATIVDPGPSSRRPYAWHLTRTEDPFGNHITYEYEPDSNVEPLVSDDGSESLPRQHGLRDGTHRWTQTYLRTIRYIDVDGSPPNYLVSIKFEYEPRPDPFSGYRAGFEIRTRKRCTRISVRTHVDEDGNRITDDGDARLVRTYDLVYADERDDVPRPLNGVSLLSRVIVTGHDGDETEQLPPLEFGYSEFDPSGRDFDPLDGPLPTRSLASPDVELADLFGNGLPDVVEMNGTTRYWRNLGNGEFDEPRTMRSTPAGLSLASPSVQLLDADGDGRIDLLAHENGLSGYFPLERGEWSGESFQRYRVAPSVGFDSPDVRLLDLDGDGVTDALRTGSQFECFFNDPEEGWGKTRRVSRQRLEAFPDVSFADERVKLANLSGDGLQDIVLVHDRNVEYWPNLGHGDWGGRVHMRNSPRLPYGYDPRRVLFGDVDGDGAADLVYVDDEEVILWINESGERWSDPIEIDGTPSVSDADAVRIVDMLGTGIGGVLWSRDKRGGRDHMFFLDFTGGTKPYLLNAMDNNMGALTRVGYEPSTKFYLEDEADRERRWSTTLPFPVQVVARVESIDLLSGGKLTTEYAYHHGYWDGAEREFRGFGQVDQFDTESFERYNAVGLHGEDVDFERVGASENESDRERFSPPTVARTWFHQGPVGPEYGEWKEPDYSHEYWSQDPPVLNSLSPVQSMLAGLPSRRDRRDALRTLRGRVLRTELYALDGSEREDRPYTVTEAVYGVSEITKTDTEDDESIQSDRSVFFPYSVASRTTQWERGEEPMTQLSFVGAYDEYGRPGMQVAFAVPRVGPAVADHSELEYLGTCTLTDYAQNDTEETYIVDRVARITTYEVTSVVDGTSSDFDPVAAAIDLKADVEGAVATAVGSGERVLWPELDGYELIGQSLNFYDGAAFTGEAIGEIGEYGAATRTETLVLTDEVLIEGYSDQRHGYTADDPIFPGDKDHPYFQSAGTASWSAEYPDESLSLFRGSTGVGSEAADPTRPGLSITPLGYGFADGNATPFVAEGYYVTTARQKYDFHESESEARGLVRESRGPRGSTSAIEFDEYDLLPEQATDPIGLTTKVEEYDYRLFQPKHVVDPNENETRFEYTPLGLPKHIVVMGSSRPDGTYEGDSLDKPGTSFEYDFRAFVESPPEDPQPIYVHTKSRIDYGGDEFIETREYSDGFGRLVQTRTQAEDNSFSDGPFGGFELDNGEFPEVVEPTSPSTEATPRVVVSGWQIYDNKGRVVEAYEPFFGDGWEYLSRQEAEELEAAAAPDEPSVFGAAVRTYYDPRGQAIRTVTPDGSEQRVIYGTPVDLEIPDDFDPTAWEVYTYDANDNAGRTHPSESVRYDHHWNTPSSASVDALGRTVETIERTRDVSGVTPDEYRTVTTYDIRGNPLTITDQLGRITFSHVHDLADQPLCIDSIDAGVRLIVRDAAGNEVERRDSKGALAVRAYDELSRPTHVWARNDKSGSMTLRERIVYGDNETFISETEALENNLLGTLYRHYDEAGLVTIPRYDFQGNLREKARRVIADAVIPQELPVDWKAGDSTTLSTRENVLLEGESESFESSFEYDALDRVTLMRYPEDVDGERKELQPTYNRAGALKSVSVSSGDTPESYVDHIAYDAEGQRTFIAHGNGVMTRYAYDPETFRLTRLRSETLEKDGDGYRATGDVVGGDLYQNFTYEYDLGGNITSILDQTPGCGVKDSPQLTHDHHLVRGPDELIRKFEYDPRYRLVRASGRECTNLQSERPMTDYKPCGYRPPGVGMPDTTRENAPEHTTLYWELYEYDAAGNMTKMRHAAPTNDRNSPDIRWTRSFGMGGMTHSDWEQAWSDHVTYDEERWSDAPGNQLTNVGDDGLALSESHKYDSNGNLVVQRTPAMYLEWDYADQMWSHGDAANVTHTSTRAYYLYDAAGQRVKKVVEKSGFTEATVYMNRDFEYHRKETVSEIKENNTLHVIDGQRRVATVRVGEPFDTSDVSPVVQYHLNDHLWSSNIVIASDGSWINLEEYSPYGETTYGGYKRKRYRYAGKERDEESGLNYHDARYYVSWLGRWTSTDPIGVRGGLNSYEYARSNPILLSDTNGQDPFVTWNPEQTTWYYMAKGFGSLFEFSIGGRANPDTGEVRGPTGGVGGMAGGAAHTLTFRQTDVVEDSPSTTSQTGMEFGASLVPFLDNAQQLVTGESVTGRPVNRLNAGIFLLVEVAASGFGIYAARGGISGSSVLGRRLQAEIQNKARRVVAAGELNKHDPFIAGAHDPATNTVYFGRNSPPTREIHPVLQQKMDEFEPFRSIDHPKYYGLPGQEHAEINALNEALWARQAALGRNLTAEDLKEITLEVQMLKGKRMGQSGPRCSRCNIVTQDTEVTSGVKNAEKEQMNDIIHQRNGYEDQKRPF